MEHSGYKSRIPFFNFTVFWISIVQFQYILIIIYSYQIGVVVDLALDFTRQNPILP